MGGGHGQGGGYWVVFLDMSAAFDMVSHRVLLQKLLLYGFDITSFTWVKSYLSDRKQTVCIDGTCSPLLPLVYGVPQGSILGPLLYIIFTNDLPESVHQHPPTQEYLPSQEHPHQFNMHCSECGGICCFADDSSFTFSSKTAEEISENLTISFTKISDYMASHELKLNSDKTHVLLLMSDESHRAKRNFHIHLNTQKEIIYPTKSEKLLGGIVGQNLKFTEHIRDNEDSMVKILNNRLNALKKVGRVASFKSRKMVYSIQWWSGCNIT